MPGVLVGLVVARLAAKTELTLTSEPSSVLGDGDVQILTAPSCEPVANMNVSQAWFQAMHVRSPPTVCERMWCSSVPDSRSHMWTSPAEGR